MKANKLEELFLKDLIYLSRYGTPNEANLRPVTIWIFHAYVMEEREGETFCGQKIPSTLLFTYLLSTYHRPRQKIGRLLLKQPSFHPLWKSTYKILSKCHGIFCNQHLPFPPKGNTTIFLLHLKFLLKTGIY